MYKFTEDCLIGISEIDKEHEELFRLINEAQKILNEGNVNVQVVKNLVSHLEDYAANHFAHEEAYMEEIRDPELERQKKEHAQFKSKIMSVDFDNMSDEDSAKELSHFVEFLARWLYHHILGSDIMIGKMPPLTSENTYAGDENKKSMFEFTDDYKTNIDIVDEEHRKLFEIVERTYEVINADLIPDKYDHIVSIIDELKDYTKLHFEDEEKYMESIGYEGLKAQKLAHESFVERLAEINMEEVDDSQQEYLCELIDFLLGWLKNHILKMDKKIPAQN